MSSRWIWGGDLICVYPTSCRNPVVDSCFLALPVSFIEWKTPASTHILILQLPRLPKNKAKSLAWEGKIKYPRGLQKERGNYWLTNHILSCFIWPPTPSAPPLPFSLKAHRFVVFSLHMPPKLCHHLGWNTNALITEDQRTKYRKQFKVWLLCNSFPKDRKKNPGKHSKPRSYSHCFKAANSIHHSLAPVRRKK